MPDDALTLEDIDKALQAVKKLGPEPTPAQELKFLPFPLRLEKEPARLELYPQQRYINRETQELVLEVMRLVGFQEGERVIFHLDAPRACLEELVGAERFHQLETEMHAREAMLQGSSFGGAVRPEPQSNSKKRAARKLEEQE